MTINDDFLETGFQEYQYETDEYVYGISLTVKRNISITYEGKKFDYVWFKNDLFDKLKYHLNNVKNPEHLPLKVCMLEPSTDRTVNLLEVIILVNLIDIVLPIIETPGAYILCAGTDDPVYQNYENKRIKPFKDFSGNKWIFCFKLVTVFR